MPALDHDGIRFSYADVGDGPPLIFQHGLGGDAAQPASQAPAGFRLITLECRGHGRTPLGPEDKLGFETFARDLDALLDTLGVTRVVLGGISMGAGVALRLARLRPERVRGLVLVRPAWVDRVHPDHLRVFADIATLLREHGPRVGKELFVAQSRAYRRIVAISPAAASSLAAQFDRPHAREHAAVLERLPADRPMTPTDAWSAVSMPTLVVGARRDAVHPFACAAMLCERLPNATLCEVPSKEDGETEHRRAVAGAIERLVAGLGRAATPPGKRYA
jgi:pimeloyl-ACP methyl ester carboxylesterase